MLKEEPAATPDATVPELLAQFLKQEKMSAPTSTFEVTYWPCSDKYKQNPTMMEKAFKQLLGPDGPGGLNQIFNGIDLEKNNAYAFLNWNTIADHKAFLADTDKQVPFAQQFAESEEGGIEHATTAHAVLATDATLECLRAPYTEWARVKARSDAHVEDISRVVDEYIDYVHKKTALPVNATYGPAAENPQELLLVIGWRSTEDQNNARSSDEVQQIIADMVKVGEFEAHTVQLQEVVV
ncbi:hypothetical protein BC834DRAFT_967496 [Gloeopeniophorella convolvens]|nr:hypothetical protein BC834DRAFT_967496 [Gloeopeniophorella convolvens]